MDNISMNNTVEKLQALIFSNLITSSPILSGNMQSLIQIGQISPSYCEIIIEAPFYDMKQWKKDGTIIYTGETIKGKTDYAQWVNDIGAFGKHNESENWVNRVIYDCANAIANEIGAVVINELQL